MQRPAQSTRQPRHHLCRSLARPRRVAQTGGHWTKQREGHGRWHRNFGCRSGTQNAQACPCALCRGCLHLPLCPGLPPQVQQHELLPGSWRLGVVRPTWVLRVVCRMLDDGCLVTDGVHRHGQRLPRKATCIGHCFTTRPWEASPRFYQVALEVRPLPGCGAFGNVDNCAVTRCQSIKQAAFEVPYIGVSALATIKRGCCMPSRSGVSVFSCHSGSVSKPWASNQRRILPTCKMH